MSDLALTTDFSLGRRPLTRPSSRKASPSILLIGPENAERRRLADYLSNQDLRVQEEEDAELDRSTRWVGRFDVVILVASLPDAGVSAFIHRVAADDSVPIMVISETAEYVERVLALELGADDLIARDTNPREVLARVRGLIRRVRRYETSRPAELDHAPEWRLDSISRTLTAPSGDRLSLSQADVDLMAAFLDADQNLVCDDHAPGAKLRTAISRLKARALERTDIDLPIRNVRGLGYRFEAPIRKS